MKELIPQSKLDFWVKHNQNVLLEGKHGIGKTHLVLDTAKRHNLKLQYFSCATLDPWVDFIGIPKQRKDKETGKYYLDLIRPKVFAFDQVQFIFLDELNRADPKIHNAVLELIQFRSINGKKFKNLKMIWAAINPPASQTGGTNYHVAELDPALMSRFNVRISLPFDITDSYMIQKYGERIGRAIGPWWRALPMDTKDAFPPRSVDFAIDYMKKGGDVADCLPKQVVKREFLNVINGTQLVAVEEDSNLTIQQLADILTEQHIKELRTTTSVSRAAAIVSMVRQTRSADLIPFVKNRDRTFLDTVLACCSSVQLHFLYSRVDSRSLPKSAFIKHYLERNPSIVIDKTATQILDAYGMGKTVTKSKWDDDEDEADEEEDADPRRRYTDEDDEDEDADEEVVKLTKKVIAKKVMKTAKGKYK